MPTASQLPDRILHLLQGKKATPLDPPTLSKRLRVPIAAVTRTLHSLEKEGRIARVRHTHYIAARDADLVTGTIQFHAKGFAFVIPPDGSPDLHIAAEDTGTALHGDLVVARIDRGAGPAPSGRRPSEPERSRGRVHRILERRAAMIVGTLQKTARFFIVIPDDPRLLHNLYIPAPAQKAPPWPNPATRWLQN